MATGKPRRLSSRRARGLVAAAAAGAALCAAAPAQATVEIYYSGFAIFVSAGVGEANQISITKVMGSNEISFVESAPGVQISAPECFQPAFYAAECDAAGVFGISASLGDRGDSLGVTASEWPKSIGVRVYGDAGRDDVVTAGGRDLLFGDGGRDLLSGGAGQDKLRARDGVRDRLIDCGAGNDSPARIDEGVDPDPVSC